MPIAKPTQAEQDYWEQVLRDHGLSMEAGRRNRVSITDRRRCLVHVGDSHDLEAIERARARGEYHPDIDN